MQWPVDKFTAKAGCIATVIIDIMALTKERSADMNISDRIQHLRKTKGISQEELADKIGVSRQAVSKWESEQSSPDIEKIILMSNFFEVTTDYLLKGIEPVNSESEAMQPKPNAEVFSIAGTAFNFIGLIAAAMIWYEEQTATATAIGLILMVMGCMIYAIGMAVSDIQTKSKAKQAFWTVNVWVISFIPLSIFYNVISGADGTAPYPVLIDSVMKYALFWIIYIIIGSTINLVIHKPIRK